MDIKFFDGGVALCKAETRSDILTLYLLVTEVGSKVVGQTLWRDKILIGDGRVERGDVKKVRVRLAVRKTYLEEDLEGIRLNGLVVDCPEAEELKGRYIGIDVSVGEGIVIEADEETMRLYLSGGKREVREQIVLLVVDDREATIALVRDLPTILVEKRFETGKTYGVEGIGIEDQLVKVVELAVKEASKHQTRLIAASSTIFMRRLRSEVKRRYQGRCCFIEGPYAGGIFGIFEVLRSAGFRECAPRVQAATEARRMEELKIGLIAGTVSYGIEEVLKAVKRRRSVITTSRYVIKALEDDGEWLRRIVKNLKGMRRVILIVHPAGELGKMVTSLGGLVAF